jgi:kynureninase
MFTGWWGHERESRFDMGHDFVPLHGAPAWQLSNPAVLPMTALLASLEIFQEATMPRIRAKSLLLTAYLEHLVDTRCAGRVEILTPRDVARRGCQLSLRFVGAQLDAVSDALLAAGVICDKRRPDVIRAAPAPLYNTFDEVWRFVDIITGVVG